MTTPKLREGVYELMLSKSKELTEDSNELISGVNWKDECFTPNDLQQVGFIVGANWALRNLHKLLEPIDWGKTHADAYILVDSFIDKRVAIVEVEDE